VVEGGNGSLYHTWTKAASTSPWGFSTPVASPPMHSPSLQISPDGTASEAETISTGGSRRVSPTGPSVPIQSPEKYFQQSLMPKPPSRTRSSYDHTPPSVVSSLYTTSYTTTSTPSYPQSRSQATRQSGSSASTECEECKSKDSFVGSSCQICGHESLLQSLTARRAPSLHSYSYSYSHSGRTRSSYSSFRSSTGGENCPECNSSDSMHLGACQVCGFSFDVTKAEVRTEPAPCQLCRFLFVKSESCLKPQQERTAHWVPYAQVKEQQDPLNFAFSQLKIRCVVRAKESVVCLSSQIAICPCIDDSFRWHLISRSQGSQWTNARSRAATLANARGQI